MSPNGIMSFLSFSLSRAGALVAVFCLAAVIYHIRKSLSKPKLLAGAPYAGLNGGKRTLEEARQHFLSHGGEMIQEGYDMVGHATY